MLSINKLQSVTNWYMKKYHTCEIWLYSIRHSDVCVSKY